MKHSNFFAAVLSICLIVISLFIASCSLVVPKLCSNLSYWKNNDYSQFQYGSRVESFLPMYNEDYSKAEFYYHKGSINFDYAEEAFCLELELNETQYNQTKESVFQSYNFLNEIPLENDKLDLTDYKIGVYDAYFLEIINSSFPHEIEVISFDNSKNIVRYCYIVSMSLDYFETEANFQSWITNNLKIGW